MMLGLILSVSSPKRTHTNTLTLIQFQLVSFSFMIVFKLATGCYVKLNNDN